MFLIPSELNTDLYQYQLDQITENDITIAEMGIAAGIEEVKSYLTPNNQIAWLDGRPRYDPEAVFAAIDTARNPLILALTKDVAMWHILQLNNTDIIWESAKEKYDRAIGYLQKLQSGAVNISGLPLIQDPDPNAPEGTVERQPFQMGSRRKFNHE